MKKIKVKYRVIFEQDHNYYGIQEYIHIQYKLPNSLCYITAHTQEVVSNPYAKMTNLTSYKEALKLITVENIVKYIVEDVNKINRNKKNIKIKDTDLENLMNQIKTLKGTLTIEVED